MVVVNAVSLNMIPPSVQDGGIIFRRISVDEARRLVQEASQVVSAIGHADTAKIVGRELGIELQADRRSITLGDELTLVAQYTGPRLPEGATELPQGAHIQFFVVRLASGEELAGRGDMVFYPRGGR